MATPTSTQLQVFSDGDFNNMVLDKTVPYTQSIEVVSSDFTGGVVPRGVSLYSRVKHSADTGDSEWSSVVNFIVLELWTVQPSTLSTPVRITVSNCAYLKAALLEDNKVFVVYKDSTNNDRIYAVVITVSGTTIIVGTVKQCNSVVSNHLLLTVLSTSKVSVKYSNASNGNKLEGFVATVTGTNITTSTPVVLGAIPVAYVTGVLVDEDTTNSKILVSTRDLTSTPFSQTYTASTTINIPAGVTSVTLSGKGTDGSAASMAWSVIDYGNLNIINYPTFLTELPPTITATLRYGGGDIILNYAGINYGASYPMAMYRNTDAYVLSYHGYSYPMTTGDSTTAIINGTTYTFSGGTGGAATNTEHTHVLPGTGACSLVMTIPDGGSLTVSYTAATNKLYSQLITVNTSTNIITSTTPIECGIRKPLYITSAKLTTNKALVVYSADTESNRPYAQIINNVSGTVSATTATLLTTKNCDGIALYALSTNSILVVYKSVTDSGKLYAQVLTISGSSITPGSLVQVASTNCIHPSLVATLSNNKIALVYTNLTDSSTPYITVLTVSGTSITSTTPVKCSTVTGATQVQPVVLSAGKMVLTYITSTQVYSQVVIS